MRSISFALDQTHDEVVVDARYIGEIPFNKFQYWAWAELMGNAKTVIPRQAAGNPYLPQPIPPFLKRAAGPHAEAGSSPHLLFH